MKRRTADWHSPRFHHDVHVASWGHYGQPVLLYPTAGGDAEECERFLMIRVLEPLIEAGRIKVYSVDSVAGRTWTDGHSSGGHRAWVQNQWDRFIYEEFVPFVRKDCENPDIELFVAGASIGAFNALASICRHPDAFSLAICMSGTYDMTRWLGGEQTSEFHFCSPLHFVPGLPEGAQLDLLRERMVILPTGEGKWEAPGETWAVANCLGARGIPNRVDLWGREWDHDWVTWRAMLPKYLDELVP